MAQIIIWGSTKRGDFAPGDVVEVLDDGISAGKAILMPGESWDGAVRPDSDFIILDLDMAQGRGQAIKDFVSEATGGTVPDIGTLNRWVRVDILSLPEQAKTQLLADRRQSITFGQFRQYVGLRNGVTLAAIQEHRINPNGVGPDGLEG